jgi:hypothetical protein
LVVVGVVAGRAGEGRMSGFWRKIKEVMMEVQNKEKKRPFLVRSRIYHRAGLTRARVAVSWRVDSQGRRRWCKC